MGTRFRILGVVLTLTTTFAPSVWAVEFSAHGYYRTRFEYTHDIDLQRPNAGIVPSDPENDSNDRFGTIAFAQQRFRLNPDLKLNDNLSIHGQIDFLDNLLFGQSDVASLNISNPIVGIISMPEANGPFGVLGTSSGDVLAGGGGNVNVRRIYADIMTSAGKFRIGRQPSHFGLGILSNDGDAPESDFGDTFDRILYLAGVPLKSGAQLNFGLAYDFLYENTVDPSIDGLDNGVGSNWNDAMQGGMILLYQSDRLELGTFGAIRFRDGNDGGTTTTAIELVDEDGDGTPDSSQEVAAGIDGDTFLYVIDLYTRLRPSKNYRISFEGVYIGGTIYPGIAIDAIVLDDPDLATSNPIQDPIVLGKSTASIIMAALETDAWWDFGGEAHLQAGFASGDSSPLSSKITQLGFRPDYDIALMLFDVPMGTSPAIRVGGTTVLGRKPISPNYVTNAIYGTLQYKHRFDISKGIPWADDFKVGGKVISAFAPSRSIDLDFDEIAGTTQILPHIVNASRWYGLEVDLSAEATFFEFMHWQTVAGVFFPGGIFDIKNDAVDAQPDFVNTIAFDNADIAIAAKTTLIFEF